MQLHSVAATCTEEGSKSRHCTRCDSKTDVVAIDLIPHTEIVDKAVEATCTLAGLTEGKHCEACGTAATDGGGDKLLVGLTVAFLGVALMVISRKKRAR